MCGITGILSFNMVGRMHLVHLEEATKVMAQRGPDAHGTWFDDHVGLGHRRLSILDLSEASNQPFADVSGRYQIVYNGEIYNYTAIKQELSGKGVAFRTTSDTEVLLQAYIHWGAKCLERLNGFFAFAIYDAEEKSLFLARDRFGIKPLNYYLDEDKFIFGSELKALMAFNIPKQLNQSALSQYLQLTYVPDQNCMLEGVQKLPPGSMMKVQGGEVKEEYYYQLNHEVDTGIGYEDAQKTLKRLLYEAVERRMVSDVPLGAFLSGGIDSSIISTIAAELNPDLKTFSIGFKDNKYFDETAYANLVAKKAGTDHTVFKLSNDDLLQEYEEVVSYFSEPFADSSAIPFYILNQRTKQEITVALSGDGADEVFSGYNKHQAWTQSQQSGAFNNLVKAGSPLWSVLPKSRGTLITDRVRQLNKYSKLLSRAGAEKYWFLAAFIEQRKVNKLMKEPGYDRQLLDELLSKYSWQDINDVLHADMRLVLTGDMLRKVDLMSMANGLEVRVPFLDHTLVDFAFRLTSQYKLHEGQRKRILKDTFQDMLPEELYTRPKHGFEVPMLNWLRRDLSHELKQHVFNRDKIEAQGIFNWKEVRRIKRQLHSLNPGDSHIQAWSLLVFQRWYGEYFN